MPRKPKQKKPCQMTHEELKAQLEYYTTPEYHKEEEEKRNEEHKRQKIKEQQRILHNRPKPQKWWKDTPRTAKQKPVNIAQHHRPFRCPICFSTDIVIRNSRYIQPYICQNCGYSSNSFYTPNYSIYY